ncbi:MAG: ATP-binding protein, partial [Defluviitaleaceae bacterium]|nr:ATP-binding protein [Defluviitaleaceae bacterium]
VSNVSHELRTPLSSIKVLSESILLQEAVPVDMYREFLRDITSEVDRMTNIVSDLLNLVKLDREGTALNIARTDLNKMLEGILKRMSPLAEQKNIDLIFENNREVTIDADEMKLSLAITNLVENGIKYTPEGGTVRVSVDADHQDAFIAVSDTGIGISEEELPKIFERFYRVDKTRDRETGGTGLGLAITNAAVLLHNGGIRVVSKENEGSIFTVRLPMRH